MTNATGPMVDRTSLPPLFTICANRHRPPFASFLERFSAKFAGRKSRYRRMRVRTAASQPGVERAGFSAALRPPFMLVAVWFSATTAMLFSAAIFDIADARSATIVHLRFVAFLASFSARPFSNAAVLSLDEWGKELRIRFERSST